MIKILLCLILSTLSIFMWTILSLYYQINIIYIKVFIGITSGIEF